MARPSCIPGPRNEAPELRFALSYEDLNTNGTCNAAQMSFNVPATSICNCSDSTTHGPAIRNRGRCNPASNPHSCISSERRDKLGYRRSRRAVVLVALLPHQRRADEPEKQGMTPARIGREFGVELTAEEPRVLRQFDPPA